MAVFLAAFLLFQSAARPASSAGVPVRDTAVRDTVEQPDTLRRVGIARPDTVLPLPGVTVRASKPVSTTGRRRESISARAMEAAGARDVADLLEARTGFFVQRYGAGGLATASLRGASSQQTLLLLDGQRLTDPQTGQVDLSLLPTALLHSAEVSYGASSARYGSGAFGGVVRLRTVRPTQRLHVKAVGEAGAWDARSGSLVLSGGLGGSGGSRFSGLLAAEASGADGDFPYFGGPSARSAERRTGAARHRRSLLGKARYRRGAHAARALLWLTDARRGLPGRITTRPSQARQWDRQARLQLADTWNRPWGLINLSAQAQSVWRRYRDPAPTNPTARADDTTLTRSLSLAASVEREIERAGRPVAITGGVEAGLDHARLRGGVRRLRSAAFAEAALPLGRLVLYPALRLDALRAEGGRAAVALSPRLGVLVQPIAYDGFRIKASLARSFRAPTFSERFNEPGGTPGLRPEAGWSGELGLALDAEGRRWTGGVEATAFATRLAEKILWRPTYVGGGVQVWRPSNVAQAVTRGVEVSGRGRLRLTERLAVRGGAFFTHLRAENRSNPDAPSYGKQLPYQPVEQLKLDAGVTAKIGGGRLTLGANGRLLGPRFVTTDESDSAPAYQIFDARLHYERSIGPARLGLGLWVENLADARYQIVPQYPMPPRHLRLRLTFETAP